MNLSLEELYRLRHALNVAAVHGEIDVNDEVIQTVKREIEYSEMLLNPSKEVKSVFDEFFKNTKLGT